MAETEKIRIEMEVIGQQQTAAAFENAAKSMAQSADALTKLADKAKALPGPMNQAKKAANDNAQAFNGMAQSTQRVLPAFSALGASVSRLNPELGQMYSAIGRASGAMGGMTAILGGVGGLAAGGLIAGVGLLADELSRTKREAKEFADAQREATEAMREFDDAARDRRQSSRQSANEWAANLGLSGRAQDLARQLQQAKEFRKQLGDSSRNIGGVTLDNPLVGKADAEIARLERELAKARNEKPDWAQSGGAASGSDVFRADPFKGQREWADVQERIARGQAGIDATKPVPGRSESFSDRHQAEIDASKSRFDAILSQARETDAELAKLDEDTQKRYDKMRGAGVEAFKAIGQSAVTLAGQVASGQKITAKEILMGIGTQLVGLGTTWLFEGDARVAESYGLDGSGYALNAIGGGAVAAGLAMMAGSVAAGAGRGGGGGGGGISRPRAAPDDPHWQTDTRGGRSAPTYNITQQNLVGDARAGQEVVKAIQQAQRQGLVSINMHDT